MNDDTSTPFIFFLTLSERLPVSFYALDESVKAMGFMLVPIRIDQLQLLISSTDQETITVMTSTMYSSEYKLYNEKIRGLLKFVLKSKRIAFFHLSSFSKLDDTKQFSLNRNYFFLKLPLNPSLLAKRVARYHEVRANNDSRWPGGKRAGVRGLST